MKSRKTRQDSKILEFPLASYLTAHAKNFTSGKEFED